jgi:hypothetical protein
MKFTELLTNKEIIVKSLIIAISIIFWIYFYVASKVNIFSVIVVDVNSIIYTFFSVNFLLFALLFPLTTVLMVIFLLKDRTESSISQMVLGTVLATIISVIFFKISWLFVLFMFLYLMSHLILLILAKKRYELTKKPFDVINYVGSKAVMIFCVVLFVVLFLAIVPKQEQNAINMQAGLVNLFVGDDLSNWIGTSASLSYACTKQNYSQIMSSPQFKKLKQNTDSTSISFVQYVEGYNEDLFEGKVDRMSGLLPDLSAPELKEDVITTMREIPLMYYLEQYFAVVFALVIVSVVYVYFIFAFSIFSLFLFYLFLLLLYKKEDLKKEPLNSSSLKETTEQELTYNQKEIKKEEPKEDIEEKTEDSSLENYFSQKNGPRKEI